MSDFDKEAERERLREKYEREEEKRRVTEQMSELLLKGATMTNAHCSDCGDPIFRFDGQEFCPTCQKPVDRGEQGPEDDADADGEDVTEESADEESEADGSENGDATDAIPENAQVVEVTDTSDDATVRFGGQNEADDGADDGRSPDAHGEDDASGDEDADAESTSADPDQTETERAETKEPETRVPSVDPTENAVAPDEEILEDERADDAAALADVESPTVDAGTDTADATHRHREAARVRLARTANRFAKLADESESPQAACEYLKAAGKAAEALAALEE